MEGDVEGQRVVAGYQILKPIASGGMGDVFLARDADGRTVALKCFRQSKYFEEEDQQARFTRERHLAATIVHPNMVRIYDHGSENGLQYIAMEYVGRGNLRDVIQSEQEISHERIGEIVSSIAEALTHLHAQGVVHRDLKPENVLLDESNQVKVTDFGLASPIEEIGTLTVSGQILGSVDYLAPEQRHRLPTDERADQYSLAVIAYELLAGEKPLGLFKPPSRFDSKLSGAVDAAVLKGLSKDSDDRFTSVAEFSAAFNDALFKSHKSPAFKTRLTLSLACLCAIAGWIWYPASPPSPLNSVESAVAEAAVQRIQKQWAEYLEQSVVEENSLGMRMILLPPGSFVMGVSDDDVAADPREVTTHSMGSQEMLPRRNVKLTRPFRMSESEITIGQFKQFVDESGYLTEVERTPDEPSETWRQPGYQHSDEYPVVWVTRNDAAAFCEWLSGRESTQYRLPTEAEWEYSCRAGTKSAWFFGDSFDNAELYTWGYSAIGWGQPNLTGTPRQMPVAVKGQRLPNAFGLFDMHGNVAEVCLDDFSPEGYPVGQTVDPVTLFSSPSSKAAVRGGGSFAVPWRQRCSVRWREKTGGVLGFRVVKVMQPDT